MPSVFASPNPVLFGRGTSKEIGEKLKEFGCTKVLVIFDQGVKKAGIADTVIANINRAGIGTVAYDDVLPDPPDWSIEEAAALGLREDVDGVVGLGGGSSMDTAKGAKLLLSNPPPINQYFGRDGVVKTAGKPLIVIPTTAGTGSENTPGGVITDTRRNVKDVVVGPGCAVSLGIVDPELTVALPPEITASTGMDAFCHAVESFTSKRWNSFSDVVAKEAITLIGKNLTRAYHEGSNIEAREAMLFASSLGGIAMSGPLCHLGHDIGKPLGANFHIPHGTSVASCLPQILEYIAPAVPEKIRFIAEALGNHVPETASVDTIGELAGAAVKALMKEINLPNFKSYGLTKSEVLGIAPDVIKFGLALAPMPTTEDVVRNLLSQAFEEN
ncbi:MAG: iron-containing alcohol dehydrogenase [Actinomycetota bacterium]|nr:iron-containing alcohol dehydrogenase [Actinomycetota bacterium]